MAYYFDNASTTKPNAEAIAAMTRCVTDHFGNPSSLHQIGLDAQHEMDTARENIADAIGAKPAEIYFTSGATESNNFALRSTAEIYGKRRRNIVTSAVEHASVKETLAYLEKQGFEIRRVFPKNGKFDAADFIREVDANTCLVTMMYVNNETGTILPVAEVFRAVKREYPEIITHCDAVQAFLKLPIRVRNFPADMISMSAHKIHGVKGVGALYVRNGVRISPLLFGGHQEKQKRPGTENVPAIAAFGAAVKSLASTISARAEYVGALKQKCITQLDELGGVLIRDKDCTGVSPYLFNISLLGYRSEIVLHFLEERDIFVSSGSACSRGASSGVLEAFGATPNEVDSAIRISFSAENTAEEIDALVAGISAAQNNILRAGREWE